MATIRILKSCIRETLNLSSNADSRTDTFWRSYKICFTLALDVSWAMVMWLPIQDVND